MNDFLHQVGQSIRERQENDPEFLREREWVRSQIAANQAAKFAPEGTDVGPDHRPQVAPVPEAPVREEDRDDDDWSFFDEAYRAVVGGLRDGYENFRKSAREFLTWANERSIKIPGTNIAAQPLVAAGKFWADTDAPLPELPEVPENETIGGKLVRPVIQFAFPFILGMRTVGASGTAKAQIAKSIGVGTAVGSTVFDPYEERLSNLILDLTDEEPWFGREVLRYLAANPEDSKAEARLKLAIEEAALGAVGEGLALALRAFRSYRAFKKAARSESDIAKGAPADAPQKDALDDAIERVMEEADEAPRKAPRTGMEETHADRLAREREEAAAQARLGGTGDGKAPRTPDPEEYIPTADDLIPDAPTGVATNTRAALLRSWKDELVLEINGVADDKATAALLRSPPERPRKAPRTGFDSYADKLARATRDAQTLRKAPRTPDPDESLPEILDDIATRVDAGEVPPKVYVDPAKGELVVTTRRSDGRLIDMDERIQAILRSPDESIRPEDLEILRAYRDLQERVAEIVDANVKPAPQVVRRAADDAAEAAASPEAIRQAVRAEVDAVVENVEEIVKGLEAKSPKLAEKFKSQGGAGLPSIMAHIAASAGAGSYGFATADPEATLAERWARAGMFALGALGVTAGTARGLRSVREIRDLNRAAREETRRVVKQMAHPALKGLRPADVVNRVNRIEGQLVSREKQLFPDMNPQNVTRMMDALAEGRWHELAEIADPHFNLNYIDSDEDVKALINAFSEMIERDPKLATHRSMTFANIEELAKDLGVRDLSGSDLFKDTKNLASRVLAMRTLLVTSASNVQRLANEALEGSLKDSDAALLAMRRAVMFHAALQARMKGVQMEVARALAQFRITVGRADFVDDEISMMLSGMGGVKANRELAEKLAAMADPRMVHRTAEKSAFARTASALYEAWVNGILSGLGTHAVNLLGNALTILMGTAEKSVAATIGMIRRGLGSTDERHSYGEILAQVQGMFDGLQDVFRINAAGRGELVEAAKKFMSGDINGARRIFEESTNMGEAYKAFGTARSHFDYSADKAHDLLGAADHSFSSAGLQIEANDAWGKVLAGAVDYLGAAMRTPGSRLLATADDIFKVSIYRGEMRAYAYRQALSEGLDGDEFVQRVSEILENPPTEAIEQAFAMARKQTFSTPLGEFGQYAQSILYKVPVLRFLMPFIRTPVNLMKYAAHHSPLGVLSRQIRDDLAAGGMRRDMALARMMTGIVLAVGVYQLHQRGLITGGGDTQKGAERLAQIPTYAIRVRDKWYTYNRMDPFGLTIGVVTDLIDISGNVGEATLDELGAMAMIAIHRNLVSKSYLKGLIDFTQVLGNSEMYGQKFVQNFVASWIPSWLAHHARAQDPVIREVWNVFDAIKARIPGWAQDVPPHLNLLGEEVRFVDGYSPEGSSPFITNYLKLASPVRGMAMSKSPLAKEVLALNLDLRHPPRALELVEGAPTVDLTPWQYHRLMEIGGALFKKYGEELVTSERYQRLPVPPPGLRAGEYDGPRAMAIRRVYREAFRQARAQLIREDRSLQQARQNLLINRQRAYRGLAPNPLTD